MERFVFYFRQQVDEVTLNAFEDKIETSIDQHTGEAVGAGLVARGALPSSPTQTSPTSMGILIPTGLIAYDKDGKRSVLPAQVDLKLTKDGFTTIGQTGGPEGDGNTIATVGAGQEKWLSVLQHPARKQSNPTTDGRGDPVNQDDSESFKFEIKEGSEAAHDSGNPGATATRPAWDPDTDAGTLMCDVLLVNGATVVLTGDVKTDRVVYVGSLNRFLEQHGPDGSHNESSFTSFVLRAGDTMTGTLVMDSGAHIEIKSTGKLKFTGNTGIDNIEMNNPGHTVGTTSNKRLMDGVIVGNFLKDHNLDGTHKVGLFSDHSHDGSAGQGQQLDYSNTHVDGDTNLKDKASSIHHSIGSGQYQVPSGLGSPSLDFRLAYTGTANEWGTTNFILPQKLLFSNNTDKYEHGLSYAPLAGAFTLLDGADTWALGKYKSAKKRFIVPINQFIRSYGSAGLSAVGSGIVQHQYSHVRFEVNELAVCLLSFPASVTKIWDVGIRGRFSIIQGDGIALNLYTATMPEDASTTVESIIYTLTYSDNNSDTLQVYPPDSGSSKTIQENTIYFFLMNTDNLTGANTFFLEYLYIDVSSSSSDRF